jgi:hypothetical protein
MAKKRILRTPKDIRDMFESSSMKFVMLNNRLFDDFYSKGSVEYKPLLNGKDGDTWLDHKGDETPYSNDNNKMCQAHFDERDFILIILLKFFSIHKFKGYSKEIADYLKYSDKRIKERLRKLQFLQCEMNNTYNHKNDKRIMQPEGVKVRLLNEESEDGYENGTVKRKFFKWHLNFDCDYKVEINNKKEEVFTPINFFKVTIYDLDLYTSGLLNEKEFITYLYFIRSFNASKEIWHSVNALSEKLNIKDTNITEKIIDRLLVTRVKDCFCKEDETFPLIHVDRPHNYERRVRDREQPSSYYKPVYHTYTIQRLSEDEQEGKVEEEVKQNNKIPVWDEDFNEDVSLIG